MLLRLFFDAITAYQQAGFLLGAFMCLGLGGLLLGNSLYWRVHSLHATGTVAGVIADNGMYTTVYRYALADGQTHEARSDSSSNTTADKATGRIVPLLVSVHDPSKARPANNYMIELIGLAIMLPGLMMGYVGFAQYPVTPLTWFVAAGMIVYLFERGRRVLVPRGEKVSIDEWKTQHGTGPIDPSSVKPIEAIVSSAGPQSPDQTQARQARIWLPLFAAFIVIIAAVAFLQSVRISRLESDGVRAPGEVVSLKEVWSSGSNGGQYNYFPIIRFQTPDKGSVEFKDGVGSNPPSHSVGDRVTVLYMASDPIHSAMIDRGPFWNWSLPAGLFAAAVVLSGVLVAFLRR